MTQAFDSVDSGTPTIADAADAGDGPVLSEQVVRIPTRGRWWRDLPLALPVLGLYLVFIVFAAAAGLALVVVRRLGGWLWLFWLATAFVGGAALWLVRDRASLGLFLYAACLAAATFLGLWLRGRPSDNADESAGAPGAVPVAAGKRRGCPPAARFKRALAMAVAALAGAALCCGISAYGYFRPVGFAVLRAHPRLSEYHRIVQARRMMPPDAEPELIAYANAIDLAWRHDGPRVVVFPPPEAVGEDWDILLEAVDAELRINPPREKDLDRCAVALIPGEWERADFISRYLPPEARERLGPIAAWMLFCAVVGGVGHGLAVRAAAARPGGRPRSRTSAPRPRRAPPDKSPRESSDSSPGASRDAPANESAKASPDAEG